MTRPFTTSTTPRRILAGFAAVLLLAVSALGAGCSVATLAYNNAPAALAYAADDWFDTTSTQADWLKRRAAALMAWHRSSELPLYRRLLDRAREQVGPALTREEVESIYGEASQALVRLGDQALPDVADFLMTLEPRQIEYLQRRFAKDNAKLAQALAQPIEKRRAQRIERYVERYEAWFGRLTDAQTALIRERVSAWPLLEEGRLADRERWQRELVALLRGQMPQEAFRQALRVLMVTPEARRDPRYQAQWREQQRQILQLTADLVCQARPAQLERIRKRLGGYVEDVAGLLRV